ncbi:hypothetical protein Tcan_01643, partial [Toxocara canis]
MAHSLNNIIGTSKSFEVYSVANIFSAVVYLSCSHPNTALNCRRSIIHKDDLCWLNVVLTKLSSQWLLCIFQASSTTMVASSEYVYQVSLSGTTYICAKQANADAESTLQQYFCLAYYVRWNE